MKRVPLLRLILLIWSFAAGFRPACLKASGPLYIGGPNDIPGQGFHWIAPNNPLTYYTDKGSLGFLTKSQADQHVAAAFAVWQGVSTETLQFEKAGDLSVDVTALNVMTVLNAANDCTTLPGPPAGGVAQQRTIIYDTDGSALTALGDDPNTILGFADAFCFAHNSTDNYFQRGFAVLNGKFTQSQNDLSDLQAVMTHEFGHMIGLDHAQINLDCLNDTQSCIADGSIAGVPIMFPVLIDAKTAPTADDITSISNLYPSSTYSSSTGEIKGHVFFSDGVTPAQGFNVIARNVTDGRVVAVSNVSGDTFTGCVGIPTSVLPAASQDCDPNSPATASGSHDPSLIGVYDIRGLPPGTYTVEVEAINNSGSNPFTGGSGLNPMGFYGFEFPLPRNPGAAPPCSPEYLVSDSTATCSRGSATTITVNNGSPVSSGTDIVLINTPPRYDAWEDGP
ncbi:MAG TPA: matrixin family metalloprotease [Terriglobia bacterium]|nr:matrixin family metalloprotease [Terriglobia bacterium]